MKTLSEVEPRIAINATNTPGDNDGTPSLFKITQPGSYYLTGNVTGVAGKCVIEIASSNVTLDLEGFLVTGGTSGVQLTSSNSSLYNVTVRNGQIAGCSGGGVDGGWGIGSLVDGVNVQHCSGTGIKLGVDSRVTDCISSYNAQGVYIQGNGLVRSCVTSHNTGAGIVAIDGTTVEGCDTFLNGTRGIDAYNEVLARGCRISHNTGNGFDGSNSCTLDGCTVSGNQGDGVFGYAHLVVRGCSIDNNQGVGVNVAGAACEVLGNSLYNNNGNGVVITSNNGRVENNHFAANGVNAVQITGTHNTVIRNVASGHLGLPYQVSVNNDCGAIVTSPGLNFSNTNSVVNLSN
jgi:hypothetical protein